MRWVLAFLILSAVIIGSCESSQRTICGDNICDKTESCACSDCAKTEYCVTKNIAENCNDNNDCTIDSFNPATNSCNYEFKSNCCGNGKCELDELKCDFTTYETKCGKDCGLYCPSKLIVHTSKETKTEDQYSFSCADQNCEKIGPNQFRLKGVSAVQTYISNIGEKTSGVVTSSFSCTKDNTKIALYDKDNYAGIIFDDFFNDGLEKIDGINSRINQNNFGVYRLRFNITQSIEPKELKCIAVITSLPDYQNAQALSITLY